MIDFNRNHFELFGLPAAYALDAEALERAYRGIQAEIHPDRFARAGEADKRLAMQWTTRVNEAYLTLRRPFERARYLLELRGIHAMDARNTTMPADFLIQQLDWREQLEEAKARGDLAALQRLEGDLREVAEGLEAELGRQLDGARDDERAAETLRKYRFMEKLLTEIDQAYEEIDAM
ncbi:MAG: Fe-S protein assembly co-chaperone HscB [Thiobacillaceae bacterium]|jgi:molecular chaperone HscB|nr:Fe-S protein assembly co-chaperone HscB [Thiobacillaceae bacterium]